MMLPKLLLFILALVSGSSLQAQRMYSSSSVLGTGTFYKIAVEKEGVYKIDVPFLAALGLTTSNINSSAIRLFGNGGYMLPEANNVARIDDLQELSIQVNDGGDGIFSGSDYLLFYAKGVDEWKKDSANLHFTHVKNLYSKKAFYFLTIGTNGRRIPDAPLLFTSGVSVSTFSERYFHELDTVNLLTSGKEWYGEEFANSPGKTLARNFSLSQLALLPGSVDIRADFIARSIGAASLFETKLNSNPINQANVLPTGAGIYDLYARTARAILTTTASQSPATISFTFSPGSFNAQGWLNWFEVFGRKTLALPNGDQLLFRDWNSVGATNAEFVIGNANATSQVWDITIANTPVRMQGNFGNATFRFINSTSQLREYVAFNPADTPPPQAIGRIAMQNLHLAPGADLIIISYPPFTAQAERIAALHRQRDQLKVLVVTTDQVFNEFASGSPDPTALRDFVKMYYDKYNLTTNKLKYLLLFGDASYDYLDRIPNNTSYVPAYENNISLDVLSTYASDDYYGFLEDQEDINSGVILNTLDVGIGRVPARTIDQAKNFADKLQAYYQSFGPWRNNITFIADDEDNNLHLQDAESIAATASVTNNKFNQSKIYLDAYRQESGSGGAAYPQAVISNNNQILNGTLIWNYTGHGGPRRLADETIVDQSIINNWKNENRLPLFITATCDFAPYDLPATNSIGENLLLRPITGGIALMTTTRVVFAFSNRVMNDNYMRIALTRNGDGSFKSLGDAVKESKNYTYQTSGDIANNRKFTLLGDPALTIAFPTYNVVATTINGKPLTQSDTLSAAKKIIIEGEIRDLQNNLLTSFNGNVYPSVFDKPQAITTLANDPGSQPVNFLTYNNALFKGNATVKEGRFRFEFKVPRDINYRYGNGRLSFYADNGSKDGNGLFENIIIGGAPSGDDDDKIGPTIKAYLNDERFVTGSVTNENPVLLLKLADSSGINTAGNGIGHDLVATLDDDNRQFYVLNEYYKGDQDSYQTGSLRFQLPELSPGAHSIKIKAWDVVNNSSEIIFDFVVAKDEELVVEHILNYPNPFTTRTQFWFEHNKPGQDLLVRIQIFTVTGRVIKVIQKTINTTGNRSSELEWDGRDEYGDKIGRGVYLYKFSVTAPGKLRKEKIEKLVIF